MSIPNKTPACPTPDDATSTTKYPRINVRISPQYAKRMTRLAATAQADGNAALDNISKITMTCVRQHLPRLEEMLGLR